MPRRNYEVFDHLLEGVQIIDPELRYVYVNAAVAAPGRSDVSTLIGAEMADIYPGIEDTEVFARIRAASEEGSPATMNERRAIARFRYRVYVEEQRDPHPGAWTSCAGWCG
jgi:PAS domain-containing protein